MVNASLLNTPAEIMWTIMILVSELYKSMLLERKFGLTTNVMATKMIPALAPQTVNPALNVEQFANIMEVVHSIFKYKFK